MINKLFKAVIGIAIGLVMLPIVITSSREITHLANGTAIDLPTGVSALIGLLPLLYICIIIGGAIAYVKFSGD